VIDHIAAFKAALEADDITTHFGTVPSPVTYPYVLLWSSSGVAPVEDSVAPIGDLEGNLGVTSVALTGDAILTLQAKARIALAAFASGSTVVAGRIVWLNLFESRPVSIDERVTLTGGAHPGFGVDVYRLRSTPA
jgi:hypothetical protein